jgi:hypothetical protein
VFVYIYDVVLGFVEVKCTTASLLVAAGGLCSAPLLFFVDGSGEGLGVGVVMRL